MTSCAGMSNLVDTGKDASVVGLAAAGGTLAAGPFGGGLAAGAAYLLVDDVNNIEFIEEHVVKTVTNDVFIEPTLTLFIAKFKFYLTITIILLLLFKREWLLVPFKFILRKKSDPVPSERLDG